MGGKQVKPPPVPQKTLKQMVKEFSKSINKLRREFQREIFKLQGNEKKMKAELEKMMKKNQPMASKRIIAQNLLRNQRFIQRYQKLDVQLQDMEFQLKTVATTDTLVSVMKGMADMMKKTNENLNVNNIEQAIVMFQTQMQRGNIMGEQIEDALNTGEQQIDDQAADNLIAQMQLNATSGNGGGGKNIEKNNDDLEDFEARLNKIK